MRRFPFSLTAAEGRFAEGSTFLFGVIASTLGLALTPLLLVICGLFTLYRMFVKKRLQKVPGYMGMMDGSDAYWATEQIYARSIINILLMVDFSKLAKEGLKPIEVMRETMKRVVEKASFKLKCKKRLSKFGYYYMEKCNIVMNENVRHIEPELRGKSDLEKFASEIANEPIIGDSLWEVLVGREEVCGSYPVFIRVHHSLGDGYALVRLFLDHMSDKETRVHKFVRADSVIQRLVNGEYNKKAVQVTSSILNRIFTYIYTSIVLAEQLLAPPDRNSLHNRIYLSGKKVCRFMEIDLELLKEVRRSLNVRFTDVLLTALSNSLEGCFVKWGETVEQMQILITARLPASDQPEELTNLFTVGMLELPITGNDKMKTVHLLQERLEKLPDLYVNYWLLRVAFTIFPATFISKYIVSTQSTLSISNVPGPKEYIKIRGSRVTDMAFFLPNRDTTGVGISFLSYADRFSIGISVDDSLLSCPSQADEILEGIVQSIGQMHSSHVRNPSKTE
uniref:Putative diacylglycerol O-acyltransferase Rv0221/MT0231 n=3 Tax=Lygus hesperus TaxID=30085 RepID=A0A0A9Y416_LYGHE